MARRMPVRGWVTVAVLGVGALTAGFGFFTHAPLFVVAGITVFVGACLFALFFGSRSESHSIEPLAGIEPEPKTLGDGIYWKELTVPACFLLLTLLFDIGLVAAGAFVATSVIHLIWGAIMFLCVNFFGIMFGRPAIKLVKSLFRFGRGRLHVTACPARAGDTLDAYLDLPLKAQHAEQVLVRLACVRVIEKTLEDHHQADGDSRRIEREIFKTSRRCPVDYVDGRTRALIQMDIPADRPPTSLPQSSGMFGTSLPLDVEHHFWTLRVSAKLRGMDYERLFEVPVQAATSA